MVGLDVLMVTPPSRLTVYQGLSTDLAAIEPPVWSGLIAAFLRRRGFAVAMLDAEAEGLDFEQTAQRIAATAPALAVFMIYGQQPSASTQCLPGASKTAARLKTLTGGTIPTLAIGTHPSALPRRTLLEEPYSYVCQGEGPFTVAALIEALRGELPFSAVPGLWYRAPDQKDQPLGNPPAPVIDDLDHTLPRQAWDLLDMARYRAHNWHCFSDLDSRGSYASIQTSLGCPFKCGFCCIHAPFAEHRLRTWSADTVIDQIDSLVRDYGIRNIKIPDEMFVLNRRHVLALTDRLIERNYGLNLWAYARIDTVEDTQMLELLKRAGFNWLALGIESGSRHVRDGVAKGRFGNTDVRAAVKRVQNHGIHVVANYIFGLPDDNQASLQETLDMALDLNTEWANFYTAMAYPGSPLHDTARAQGWRLPDDPGGPGWIGYAQHAVECLPLPTEHLSALEVLDFRDHAFDRYFTNPAYLAMIERTFGPKAVTHVQAMTTHRLRRRHHQARD
jgi:hypothetical protein